MRILDKYILKEFLAPFLFGVAAFTAIFLGADTLLKIDKVGKNLERAQGMCGASSGSIPTDVGQPAIRVSSMIVGGKDGGNAHE